MFLIIAATPIIVPMQHQLRLEHITSFADAIFAFSITFMAITIDIPNLSRNLTQAQVIEKLLESIPEFEIYVISFFVIGVYWISYHQVFNRIVGSHWIMTWLTPIFLFFITLIPFATNLSDCICIIFNSFGYGWGIANNNVATCSEE
jgi:TMEM175 potassium channel family protein